MNIELSNIRVLGLESGTFRALHRPEAPRFWAFGVWFASFSSQHGTTRSFKRPAAVTGVLRSFRFANATSQWCRSAEAGRFATPTAPRPASTIQLLEAIEALYPMLALIDVFLDNARDHHPPDHGPGVVQRWLPSRDNESDCL